jgi:hypothetical protein
MQEMVGGDNNRTPVNFQALYIFVFVGGKVPAIKGFMPDIIPTLTSPLSKTGAFQNKPAHIEADDGWDREGPSESAYMSRLQTTLSCAGKEPGW